MTKKEILLHHCVKKEVISVRLFNTMDYIIIRNSKILSSILFLKEWSIIKRIFIK